MVETSPLAPSASEVVVALGGLLAVAAWAVLVVVYLRSDLTGPRTAVRTPGATT